APDQDTELLAAVQPAAPTTSPGGAAGCTAASSSVSWSGASISGSCSMEPPYAGLMLVWAALDARCAMRPGAGSLALSCAAHARSDARWWPSGAAQDREKCRCWWRYTV